jgi:hypothetical protein
MIEKISSPTRFAVIAGLTGAVIALVVCGLWFIVKPDRDLIAWKVLLYGSPFVFPGSRTIGAHVGPWNTADTVLLVAKAALVNSLVYALVGFLIALVRQKWRSNVVADSANDGGRA